MLSLLLVSCLVSFAAAPARAQLYTASLTGIVTDPSGAVVPGADVSLVDADKGFSFKSSTDADGRYVLRNLPPGTYKLTAERQGFQTSTRQGIVLDVKQDATVDIALSVGAMATAVEVRATTPLLATQDAVTSTEVNRTFINDLPLVGRGVFDLAFLAPGVNPPGGRTVITGTTNANNFVSDGSRNMTADILVDGVTVTTHSSDNQLRKAYWVPSIDAVQEFKVQQNNFGADIGNSGGTGVNVVLRSGTNNLHGSLYEFARNDVLDANNWFNNRNGSPRSPRRYNDFGFTLGGPIRKDKTFFFADYEGSRQRTPSTFSAGVPSAAERHGDFGELCAFKGGTFNTQGMCSNPDGQLWDPYSGAYSPSQGGPVRSAFIPFNNMATYQSPGNPKLIGTPYQLPAVPGNIIDPVALKMMQFFPMPNVGVGTSGYNPYNNWAGSGSGINNDDRFDIKIDRRVSDRTLLAGRFSYDKTFLHSPNCFGNALDPCTAGPVRPLAVSVALNGSHTISPATVLTLSYGYIRQETVSGGAAGDFPKSNPVSDLGLPSYILDSGTISSPIIYAGGGYNQAGADSLGAQGWSTYVIAHEVHDLLGSLDHIRGSNEMKVGGEMRMERSYNNQPGTPAGLFPMDFSGTSQFPSSGGGDGMATFLTGTFYNAGWGQYEVPVAPATQAFSYSGYFQDNWRASDKLTLNLGLRYDLELPRTERHNSQEWFDPNLPSPLVVPGMPNLRGGEVFVNSKNRYPVDPYKKEFQPRLGLAYRLGSQTVLRAGYGIFYNTYEYGTTGDTAYGFDGYEQVTPWFTTFNNDGATPWGMLRNPWPGGPILPTGNSLGALTNVGLTGSGAIRKWNATPYTQTWSLGVQRQLPGGVLIDANYIGTKGTHLFFGGYNNLNYLGSWVESASPAQITALNTRVANPFFGIITNPASPLSAPTVPAWQLQLQFPQFTGVTPIEPPWANSIYHAFQLRVEKRFSRGLQFLASYTNSKSIDDASAQGSNTTYTGGFLHLQDPNNLKLERSVSEYDIPQVLQLSYVYQLPVGRGKQWGSGWGPWLDGFLGGWQTNGLWRFDNGQPIHLTLSGGQSLPTYGSQQPNLLGPLTRNSGSNWMDQYFANPQVLVKPAPFTVGSAPALLPNVRAPGTNTAALSLFKEIALGNVREGMRLEYRVEAFNALNHPQFCAPHSTFNAGNFGKVTCQANSPRDVQMALKLYF